MREYGCLIEEWAPVAGGALAGGFFYYNATSYDMPPTLKDLILSILTVSSMAVGFLATAKAILISIGDRTLIKNLKQVGSLAQLMRYFASAIHWSFVLAIACLLFILIDLTAKSWLTHFMCSLLIFGSITTMLSCYRAIRLFTKLLRDS